ncbi:MAG: hypothetical protein LBH55_00640, partial [Mycoplasmataceae bacterium]|nr:hypothetical protein [Mycoplasmataceae bacterium]
STLLEKDVDGWYYPNAIVRGKQENVRVFLFLVAKRLTKFHKYIDELLFKRGDDIIDYKADVEDEGEW